MINKININWLLKFDNSKFNYIQQIQTFDYEKLIHIYIVYFELDKITKKYSKFKLKYLLKDKNMSFILINLANEGFETFLFCFELFCFKNIMKAPAKCWMVY